MADLFPSPSSSASQLLSTSPDLQLEEQSPAPPSASAPAPALTSSSPRVDTPPLRTPPGPRPLWIPPGLKFDELSPALQIGVTDILNPVYSELVLEAEDPLEKSCALTFVHLLWLELIEQIDLGQDMEPTLRARQGTEPHEDKVLRHLRLLKHKDKAARFLFDVRRFHERIGKSDALRSVPQ